MSKLIRPRVEVAFHMRRPQHDLLVMQREHNFHEDGRIGHPASGIVKKGENISLVITSHQNPSVRSRAGCTKQNGPHQEEEAEELQGRYRPLRVPSSEGPRLALRCDSVLEPLNTGLIGVGHVRAPSTNPCMVRLSARSRIRCPRPWECGSKRGCQWEPLVEESPQKDGQSTNQLRWPARSGASLLPAPKRLEERFRQWARRSSPLNTA